jgi:hypothetical protein
MHSSDLISLEDHSPSIEAACLQLDSTPQCECEDHNPTFIYSYDNDSDRLWRTHLGTGEEFCYLVPSYQFEGSCCWSELSRGSLLITGGGMPPVREVVKIDTLRECAVSHQPPMLTPRRSHTCVYHAEVLYVLGGSSVSYNLRECERYIESRWEALPPLPAACHSVTGVVVEGSLYALGGSNVRPLDLIQKLRLDTLTWELMDLKLPTTGYRFPCFKLCNSEVYLVINKTLYFFTPLQVLFLKTLPEAILSRTGASYYSRGTLYCSNSWGAASRLEIGSLK